jgi:hypothetical protein
MRFEDMRHGLLKPVVATFYHWFSPSESEEAEHVPALSTKGKLTLRDIKSNPGPFYVCDDPWTWASPWKHDMQLYAIDCVIKKPFPLFEQFVPMEQMNETNFIDFKAGGFDSVIYTPHAYGRGVRELGLLYPAQQVVGCRKLHPDEYKRVVDLHHRQPSHTGWNWAVATGRHGQYATPPWEDLPPVFRPDELEDLKTKRFHEFMERLQKAIAQVNANEVSLRRVKAPELLSDDDVNAVLRAISDKGKKGINDAFEYECRVQFVKTFGKALEEQQAAASFIIARPLDPDEVVASGAVFDYMEPLPKVIQAMYMDDEIVQALMADGMQLDENEPFGIDSPHVYREIQRKVKDDAKQVLINEHRTQHEPAGKVLEKIQDPPHGLTGLADSAKAERAATLAKMPATFHQQQKEAAAKEGYTLDPDQVLINGWVYDAANSIEEIIDALQNDEAARAALEGHIFDLREGVKLFMC